MPYIPEFTYEDHLTYKIKKNDTLISVAKQLVIRPDDLRSYHNKFCPLQDLIEADFPNHLRYVILAPEKIELSDEEKEKIRKKAIFNDGAFGISLNQAQTNISYGVLYTIESGATVNTIKQQVNVKWKAKSENGYYFFEVNRIGSVYINDTAADSMVQDIAEKASAALYPLLVVVDENGKWVYINNFNEIETRWQKVKKEIRKYYKGDQVEKYLAIYDRNLEDDDTLYLSLSKDWFLNAFFNGIHVQYSSSLSIEKETSFPSMAKSENINYNVQQKLDAYLDIDDFLVIDINGKLHDDRTKTDFEHDLSLPIKEYSEEKPEGNYRAKYFLNPQNYMPESIFISCDLKLDTPQNYTVTISNLDDKKEISASPRQELFIEETKPQKKWWQL
ncbi:peptidoglycan-binding protein LysM [Flavobacterium hercynium]|uniref:LysM domain-containing protein n=1 Tax=Flavobacterium hercynium TaxID=387094 RepID=A0A226HL38_9FLAO|nr:peptidoglycan-binding protein LysM [Flavobacterium hercynium]OXA94366.1 hypothetical protein B0A66_04735 [Flavobacterium hercynium]SMP29211.1 hypothetical protein SAMN06265346_11236 [Flavobacterium hercynium]